MRIAALLFALAASAAPAAAEPLHVEAIVIEDFPAVANDSESPLLFIGGLQLRSAHEDFGGLSGVDIRSNGRAFFVGDTGIYVEARLVHEGNRLSGVADARIGRLFPNEEGTKKRNDAEDIAFDPENPERGVVVRERKVKAIHAFGMKDGRPTNYVHVPLDAPHDILLSNRGLESVAFAPAASPLAGDIVTIAERPRGGDDIPAWIVGKGRFSIVRHDGFDISSARFLPNGDLLLLERRQRLGWGMRLRRIDGNTLAVGARLDGPYLVDAGRFSGIDNMEGLAVHRDDAGRTILTLVSDDNYSILQRTLVLQFALADD